jgi:hypothetical protein
VTRPPALLGRSDQDRIATDNIGHRSQASQSPVDGRTRNGGRIGSPEATRRFEDENRLLLPTEAAGSTRLRRAARPTCTST